MTIQTFALMAPVFLFLSFAVFIYFKGQNSRLNRVFILFVLNMAMWSLSLAVFYLVKTTLAITFWAKVDYLLASLIPPLFVLFAYIFPDGNFKISKLNRVLLFMPSVLLGVLYFTTPLIIKSAFEKNGVRGFEYGPLRFLWDVEYKGIFVFGFYRFLTLYRAYHGVTREKIKYIIIANLYLSFLGGVPNVVLPVFKIFNFIWLGPIFSLIWLVIIVFAIVKYRLVDVRVGFSNMGIFAGVYFFVLGIPIYLYSIDHKFLALLVAITLATLGPFTFSRFRKLAEEKILEEEKRYQDALLQASKALRGIAQQEKIISLVSNLLFKAMKLSNLSIYLKEEGRFVLKESRGSGSWEQITIGPALIDMLNQQGTFIVDELEYKIPKNTVFIETVLSDLKQRSVAVAVPIVYNLEFLGLILLGEKNNHVVFSNRDVFVFNILADYAAFALYNARRLPPSSEAPV